MSQRSKLIDNIGKTPTPPTKDVAYYLALPWTYQIDTVMEDGEPCYYVTVLDLPTCMTDGDTLPQALANIQDAITCYVKAALADGHPIPEPIDKSAFKGKISLRTTPEIHYKVAKAAQHERLSVNRWLEKTLERVLNVD
jgi:predicted RNase H-like HicB family nuclease